MKGSRAAGRPASTPEGSSEGVDLSLTGLPPPVSWRPNSASAAKPIARSFSVVAGSEPRRKAPEGSGGSRTINNLRRSNSTTQVHQPPASQAWTGPPRPAESPHVLTLSEGSPGGKKRAAGLSKTPSEKAATWNVLDDQPRAFTSPPDSRSPSTVGAPVGPRRRECTVPLAPSFTANNRSNKGTVGNCVTTMVHNHYTPPERAPPPKSSNHTAPSLNNILKAATGAGGSGSFGKLQGDQAGSKHVAQNNAGGAPGPLRRKEVTEEEAERFIHQVNRAAVTIQRWYRHQVQRRQARAARLECLPASNQEGPRPEVQSGLPTRRSHWLPGRTLVSSGAERRQEQRRQLGGDSLLDQHQKKEAARRKAREEKARQARRAAIQELQQKRAQKSGDPELKEAWGPEKPRPAQELPPRPGGTTHTPQTHKANNAGAGFPTARPEEPCQSASPSSPEPRQLAEDKPQDASAQGVPGEDLEVGDPARSRAKSRATLDELLDTLKLLEEEPEPLPRPRAYRKDKYSWTDEEDDASNLTADNLERFGKLSTCDGPSEDGTLLSEAKLQSIMSFLHEMEMEQSGQDRPASAPQGLALEDGRPEPGSTVSTSVMRLKLEVEEKKQAVGLLQRALVQQRDLTIRRVKETEKELGRQLRQQRDHYEATIQRHLSFIDQLIEDKKALAERCEAVVAELKQRDQRRKDREAQVQEQHELEIKKLKELMSATEKVRREKWINEKTRKIKEITVRGLEPEIQKLIARHKQEVKKLKSLHEAELLQADARAAQRCARQVEELREQLEREKEALGQQERERAQQRFEQHVEQEQRALQQQRRRLYGEVAEEKERLGQQAARQRAELEELRRQLEESSAAEGRALRAEFEKGREEQERRHQMEMKALKDQLEVERQMWEANCAKKEEAWLLTRERELREEVRRGRDKEIELVIHRLEADMTRAREESERAAESRVQRLRDKYDAELSELEQSERKLQERCTELKGRLGEAEGEGLRLQGLLRHKEKELARVTAVNEQLVGERSGLAEVLRREFADRLAASEEDTRLARAELAELRARQRLELEQLSREKQAELEEVHQRVKLALAKKEEAVRSLRKQHEAAVKRADHLEELLEQRKWPLPSAK
ncbi:Centrosomal protein of 131 kDa [Vulpes lagopus]